MHSKPLTNGSNAASGSIELGWQNNQPQSQACPLYRRLIQNGRAFGYVYVLQSETARYSDSGTFHWDVSNPKLLLNVSDAIEGMSELSVETLNNLTK